MKRTNFSILAMAVVAGSVGNVFAQGDLNLDLAALTGSQIVFSGHSFNFTPASPSVGVGPSANVPDQWYIVDEYGPAATPNVSVGLDGSFTGGPFNYGMITTTVDPMSGLSTQDALVSNTGTLLIGSGAGALQGTVNFIDVRTVGQVGGLINSSSVMVNLSNIIYNGLNPDLQFLAANQPGEVDLSFQFAAGGKNLTQLSDGGVYATSYSGSISVNAVPEPSSLAMSLLGGLGGLGLAFRKRN